VCFISIFGLDRTLIFGLANLKWLNGKVNILEFNGVVH